MYYKLLNEEGNFKDLTTGEYKNLLMGYEITTPYGIVNENNLQNFFWFENEEDALIHFNLEKITNDDAIL